VKDNKIKYALQVFFMDITILGSGTLLSGPHRNPSGYLLCRNSDTALLDCGPGILRQLKVLNINLLSVRTILLSHYHLDHCSDVLPLLMNRYLLQREANTNLSIIGPPGLKNWFAAMASSQGAWLLNALPKLIETGPDMMNWADIPFQACPTEHTESSVGYKFSGSESFFYSGDTDFNADLVSFASGVHTAILECSHPDNHPQAGHLTPSSAARFAARAGFSRLILSHFYPENDPPRIGDNMRYTFSGQILIAEDFMKISLQD